MLKPLSIVSFPSLPLLASVLAPVLTVALSGCASSHHSDAGSQEVVPTDAYLADVTWLSDDARKGRDTDSPELLETAAWVSEQFEDAGLEPIGDDGTWLQHFTVKGQRVLIDGNVLRLGDDSLRLEGEWMPLQTAMTGAVEGEVVFAGYGISDPEGGYDDYAGLDVQGKLVLVLRRGPKSGEEGSRYSKNGPGGAHITFATKVNAAFRHGAAALLVVNGPADYAPASRDDRVLRYTSLEVDAATASLPAAHLSARAALAPLSAHGLDLAAAQKEIDGSLKPQSRPVAGLRASLTIAAQEQQLGTENVLGLLRGSDPALAEEYVIVGGHMDHLGTGQHIGSRGENGARGQIHNGADDNASGTAGTIAVARLLAEHPELLRRSVVFAAWSGEEWGLLGSRHYAAHPSLPLERCVAVINMDMIGRSVDDHVIVEGMGTSPGFRELVTDTEGALGQGLDLALADRPSDNSDHASFVEKDIPVLNFFTGLHDDYHKPSDDVEKINAAAGAKIATLAARVAEQLAMADERPPFTKVAPPQNAVASPHGTPGGPASGPREGSAPAAYKVVLGTSPDMGYDKEDGVRISSVRPDTPAEKAGLMKGDVIVAFDGLTVRTLQDYATLLFSHKPGDKVVVSVRRGDHTLELTATLEGQAGGS